MQALLLFLDLLHECLVQGLLLLVHSLRLLLLFSFHLLFQEVLRVLVDLVDFLFQASVFFLPKITLLLPHLGLLIELDFFLDGTLALLLPLLEQRLLHVLLGPFRHSLFALLFLAQLEFTLSLVFGNHLILLLLQLFHLGENTVSHAIHELLRSLLTSYNLVLAIFLLLVEHSGVFFLHADVISTFTLLLFTVYQLVLGVLFLHLLEVFFLLASLLLLDSALLLHLVLEPLDRLDLLLEVLSGFVAALHLVLRDLSFALLFLQSNLLMHLLLLLLLTLVHQLEMRHLHPVVLLGLFPLSDFLCLLLLLLFF